jgi:hypothetical protein
MIKILSNMLVLKNVTMEKEEATKTFIINLSFKNLDGKLIKQSFNYHNYDEAINDFMVLTKMIKEVK